MDNPTQGKLLIHCPQRLVPEVRSHRKQYRTVVVESAVSNVKKIQVKIQDQLLP